MKTKTGETPVFKGVQGDRVELLEAALEVLARKFLRIVSGCSVLDKSFDKAVQYQIDYAKCRARKNLKRRKKR